MGEKKSRKLTSATVMLRAMAADKSTWSEPMPEALDEPLLPKEDEPAVKHIFNLGAFLMRSAVM